MEASGVTVAEGTVRDAGLPVLLRGADVGVTLPDMRRGPTSGQLPVSCSVLQSAEGHQQVDLSAARQSLLLGWPCDCTRASKSHLVHRQNLGYKQQLAHQ